MGGSRCSILIALMMVTTSLAGCLGGDDGRPGRDELPVDTLDDWQVHFADSASDLPECNDDRHGWLYYVSADENFQVCTQTGWEIVEIAGSNGADGSNGEDGLNGVDGLDGTSILINVLTSTTCLNGGNTFEIGNDADADGILGVTEVEVTVDICNGTQGPEGPQGPAGTNGTNGTDGQDGLNALVSMNPEPSGSNCGTGGTRIDVGVDDNSNGVLEASEIDQSQYVCDGGSSNNTVLTSISSPPIHMGCDAGGRVVAHGLDNGDGGGTYANGILEHGEVDWSTTYCSRYVVGILIDMNSGSESGLSGAPEFTFVGNTLYFFADDGTHGKELWKSDGTATGTMMVKDISSGSSGSYPYDLIAIGNTLFFTASDGTNGSELWKSDGTASGTVLVKDINSGSGHSYPGGFTAVGSTLFFSANDGTNGIELWKSDGTTNGTMMVKDINPGGSVNVARSSSPSFLTAIGSTLFFRAEGGTPYAGKELWKSDGTSSGTVMVKDINSGGDSGSPNELTAIGSTLYFKANDGINGNELWKSDGTTNGTMMVRDLNSGSSSSSPTYLTAVGNTLYFRSDDGTNGAELWKSDGTTNGTVMVKDICSGSSGGYPHYITAVGSTLYFVANDGTNGYELWKSDGTASGTVMVKDIYSGSGSSDPVHMTAVGNSLYFTASDGTHGYEFWKSNGTASGTMMVEDINSGSGDGNPSFFIAVGSTLYFRATDGDTGYELFSNQDVRMEITYN